METLAAIVKSGIVGNVIVIDPANAATITNLGAVVLPQGSLVQIGWTYDGASFAAPVPTLVDAQTQQIELMNSSYATAESADIAYMSTVFQADDASQALITKVLSALAGTSPSGFAWADKNNVAVAMTNAQLQGLSTEILTRNQPLFWHCQAQKASIRAATTVADVQAVVW